MALRWLALKLAAVTTLMLVACLAAVSAQPKPGALFVIGDSLADDGNWNSSDPNQQLPWRKPYGITWPGHPTGRFSDGHVSTDFFADFWRVGYTPPPFASISNSTATKYYKRGVDFAQGAAGVFPDYGFPTVGQQVEQLERFISQHPDIFSPHILQTSILYLAYGGNDYDYHILSNNGSIASITPEFVSSVVQGIDQAIRSLYAAGFRNFVVTYLPRCSSDSAYNADGVCSPAYADLATQHSQLLRASLERVLLLPGAHVAALDLFKTFNYVVDNAQWFGFTNTTAACCSGTLAGGTCGDVDAQGNPLYQLCQNRSSYFWWDFGHPTEDGWNAIANLLNSGYNFTDFTPNLVYWLNSLNLVDIVHRNQGRVARDVQQAVQAVNASGQFNLVLDVVSKSNLLPYAPEVLSQTWRVTLFLPTDSSIVRQLGGKPVAKFLQDSPQVGLAVLSIHAVYGWWPAQRLLALPSGSSLKTVAGTGLFFYKEAGGLFLGAPSARGGVQVVRPDIYKSSYTGVIHGIHGVLIPTYIRPVDL